MDQQKATQKISRILKDVEALIAKAEAIADEHKICFSYSGPSYGMGGYYDPSRADDNYSDGPGWLASSRSC